ncbi:NAD-P-binding protein [Peniophora sp. CONT]|nr:NAD-P-binding protein [Peniophora sp. CONT]
MQAAQQKTFLSAPKYAVIGASKDQSKWGTKVLQWYIERDLSVTPVHPKESELEGIAAVKDISEIPDLANTSVSLITNPAITLNILKSLKEKDISPNALWLQPGVADQAVTDYLAESGLEEKAVFGGPCILVLGDGVRKSLL